MTVDGEGPHIVFGAALQAQHALGLAKWMGKSILKARLFEDSHVPRRTGAFGLPIAGTIDDGVAQAIASGDSAIVAIGSRGARFRWELFRALVEKRVSLVTLVHPHAELAPDVTLGDNVLVMPGCVISTKACVGSLVCLFANATIEHDASVGNNVTIGPGVVLAGGSKVEAHAFVGAGAVVAPGVTVGAGTLVGAGAVVVRDLPPSVVAMGTPARTMRAPRMGDDVPTAEELKALILSA